MDFLHKSTEGRIRGTVNQQETESRIQMPHDLANDGGYVALKLAAEVREGWSHRERMSKPALQQKTTDDDSMHTWCPLA